MVSVQKTLLVTLPLIIISFFLGKQFSTKNIISTNQETRQSGYRYTSPLLSCDNLYSPPDPKLGLLKKDVEQFLAKQKPTIEVSVFFRHLNNGPVFGINEHAKYSPASLLKVPIMIALLKQADSRGSSFLDQKILVKDLPITAISETPPPTSLKPNTEYSVSQLIESMIKNSDNQAAAILKKFIGQDSLLKTYFDLGIDLPTGSAEDPISTKTYSSLFRILYNASYLSHKYSEYALSLLSQTTYSDGLAAKLPQYIEISHKFGERSDGNSNQLHDCGIIYFPNNPYLLCIMTKGEDRQILSGTIAKISELVYETLNKGN
jgi:beta-lactamase class A